MLYSNAYCIPVIIQGRSGLPGLSGEKGSEGARGRDGTPGMDGFPGKLVEDYYPSATSPDCYLGFRVTHAKCTNLFCFVSCVHTGKQRGEGRQRGKGELPTPDYHILVVDFLI